jgi:microtubule-associated serine/threonine kinase
MHPWFKGVDWTDLARTKAAFVPVVDDDTDTSYFEKKHVSAKVRSYLHQYSLTPAPSLPHPLPSTR